MFIAIRRTLVLALAVIAVILIAGCGSSKKDASSSSGAAAANPAAIIPAGAPLYVEATVKPSASQAAAINALSSKILKEPAPGAKLVALIDKAGTKDNLSYEADIKPWLGDKVALAVTSYGTANKPDFVAVVNATDTQKALDTIDKSHSEMTKGTTSGVDYEVTSDGSYVGAIGDFLVFGTPAAFKAVAAGQEGDKLTDQPSFKAALAKSPADKLGFAYIDVTGLLKLVASTDPTVASQLTSFKGLLGGITAVSASLVATPTSIELDATTVGGKVPSSSGTSTIPLGKAPADALAAVAVSNLGPTLKSAVTNLGNIGAATSGTNFAQVLSQLKATTGLDINQDLLSWMGDAGAFVKGSSPADIGGAVVIHSTDPAKSKAAVAKIASLLTKIGRSAQRITVPGGVGIQFATTATGPPVQLAAAGSTFVIAFGKGALDDALNPTATLDSTANYTAAVASLKGTPPSAYVDVQSILGLVDGLLASNAQYQKVKPYLDPFTSVIAGSKDGVAKIVVNVK